MRYFSLQDANAFVPTLSAAFDDIARLRQRIAKLTFELGVLKSKADADTEMTNGDDAFAAMKVCRGKIADAVTEIRSVVGEIESHGVIVKELDGAVDFRARRGQRQVYLSWHKGEAHVETWHDEHTELTQAIDQRFEKALPN
jgi:hypothetical protein